MTSLIKINKKLGKSPFSTIYQCELISNENIMFFDNNQKKYTEIKTHSMGNQIHSYYEEIEIGKEYVLSFDKQIWNQKDKKPITFNIYVYDK